MRAHGRKCFLRMFGDTSRRSIYRSLCVHIFFSTTIFVAAYVSGVALAHGLGGPTVRNVEQITRLSKIC